MTDAVRPPGLPTRRRSRWGAAASARSPVALSSASSSGRVHAQVLGRRGRGGRPAPGGGRRLGRRLDQVQNGGPALCQLPRTKTTRSSVRSTPGRLPPGVPNGPAERGAVIAVPVREVCPRRLREGQPEDILDGIEAHGLHIQMLRENPDEDTAAGTSSGQGEVDPVTVALYFRMPLAAVRSSAVGHLALPHEPPTRARVRAFRRKIDPVLAHGRGDVARQALTLGENTRKVIVQGAEYARDGIAHCGVTAIDLDHSQ